MSKASARPLIGPTSHDHHKVEPRVAMHCVKRSYGFVSCMSRTQTNVWALYRVPSVCAARGVSDVSPRGRGRHNARVNARVIASARLRCDARPPFPPPPYRSVSGGLPQFFPTFSTAL
jgi:hypothetical protein